MVSEIEDVAGKNAIITGGASGLGLAMAKSFASAGINVAITDIEERALAEALKGFEDSSTRVIGIKADVTNREDMAQAKHSKPLTRSATSTLCVTTPGSRLKMCPC